MAEELERNGDKAIVDEDYDQALILYSKAIELDPNNASVYVSRAAAHIKLQSYTDAVSDANRALQLNPGLARAYLRKGTACFSLEEYHTAKSAFEAGAALDPNNTQFKLWIRKCDAELIEEAAADKHDTGAVFSAPSSGTVGTTENAKILVTSMEALNGGTSLDPESSAAAEVPSKIVDAQPKYRHEWYQTQTQMVVTVFAKNIKQEQINVQFGDQNLSVVIDQPNEEAYSLQLSLFGKIKPLDSKYNVLSTKVEIRLAKLELVQWKGLETDPTKPIVKPIYAVPAVRPPAKKATKNWDKLEAEVKQAEKDEKLEGDAALNKLFQDIYRNADEDTRRAMNKSFVESNGTVLSTNWKEVGSKVVEGSPPKGMEMKKWEH